MWLSVLILKPEFIMLCNNDNVSNILKKNPKLQMRRYDPGVVLLNSLSLSLLWLLFSHIWVTSDPFCPHLICMSLAFWPDLSSLSSCHSTLSAPLWF